MTKLENMINVFRARITSGEFKPGERIPSEYDFAESYKGADTVTFPRIPRHAGGNCRLENPSRH